MFIFSRVIVSFLGMIMPFMFRIRNYLYRQGMYQVFYPFHGLCASLFTNGTTNGNGHEIKFKTSTLMIVVAFTELLNILLK